MENSVVRVVRVCRPSLIEKEDDWDVRETKCYILSSPHQLIRVSFTWAYCQADTGLLRIEQTTCSLAHE